MVSQNIQGKYEQKLKIPERGDFKPKAFQGI